jgi:hypothetical protein
MEFRILNVLLRAALQEFMKFADYRILLCAYVISCKRQDSFDVLRGTSCHVFVYYILTCELFFYLFLEESLINTLLEYNS